jgi:hypothetical protein
MRMGTPPVAPSVRRESIVSLVPPIKSSPPILCLVWIRHSNTEEPNASLAQILMTPCDVVVFTHK